MTTFSLRRGGQTLGCLLSPRGCPASGRWTPVFLQSHRNFSSKKARDDPQTSIQKPTKTSSSDGLCFKILRWTSQGTKGEQPASSSRRRQASICLWLDCLLMRARCSRSRPARDHICPEPRSSLLCSGSFPPSLFTTHTPKAWLRVPFTRGQSLVREWMAQLHGQASLWRPAGGVHPRAERSP